MRYLFFVYTLLYATTLLANTTAPFPLFLKTGFSSVIEFNEVPTQVVLGDSQSFQIEKLNRSLAIRTNNPNTSSNMFVYFNEKEPYVFILTSSDEAEPTFYKKMDFPKAKPLPPKIVAPSTKKKFIGITSSHFDTKKDLLTVEVLLRADATSKITPSWERIRLKYKGKELKPKELWSEREVVQKDALVKARFSFIRPDIPKSMKDVLLIIPTKESKTASQLKFSNRGAK